MEEERNNNPARALPDTPLVRRHNLVSALLALGGEEIADILTESFQQASVELEAPTESGYFASEIEGAE